ncbi:F0F1 ATP synthase subunit A [Parapedobacter indicus]|uniref:ATP synthase subunit a n=1 Tax=Parapedobacter indicus TaxID=1477437 RepID=A0A1I3N2I6_9SPHI|nr:F0F1 ATP synthase subunit A [Parapedobacter indicus]PPL00860.1 ATP synthase F0 subcomplex A subunit [Parapedobacter indicus]SFJ03488.1 ATP synthase F0 subcomplex A subunit [Parapedobacter indicus]
MDFRHFFDSKKISFIAIFAVLATFSVTNIAKAAITDTVAATGHEAHGEEEFEPTKMIMEHISDAHDWHLWGHTSIPLPVILYTDKGMEVFLSSKFHHGEHDYQGKYYTYRLVDKKKIKVVDTGGEVDEAASQKVWDFSITKNVASMFLAVIVLLLIFSSVARAYKKREGKAPKGLQSFLEPLILFVRDDIARPNIGHTYARYMPLLLTIFFFIWFNNLLGLIPIFPGAANVTGNIAVTFVLAFIVLIVVNINGNRYYWKHILTPDVPWWLYPIMIPVELVGVISKPFALMIRLFANITAGHIVILSLISLIFVFQSLAIAPVSLAFVLFMNVLELLVAALQAFIFTLLTALFIGMAVEEHH